MSSEKDLNRSKWQHSQRNKPVCNKKHKSSKKFTPGQQGNQGTEITLSSFVQAQPLQKQQPGQTVPNFSKDPTAYLDNFDLDFDDLNAEDDVIYNSDGFDFEQLLYEAQANTLLSQRSWSLSQDFEDKQPSLEQPSQILQIDLQMLGQALEDLPLTQLLGIDSSFFDSDVQHLTWKFSDNHQSKTTQLDHINEGIKDESESEKEDTEWNQFKQIQTSSDQINCQGTTKLLLQNNDQNDFQPQLKQQEDDLDELLQTNFQCTTSHNVIRKFNNDSIINNEKKHYQPRRFQQIRPSSQRQQNDVDSLDDELDQLLQL